MICLLNILPYSYRMGFGWSPHAYRLMLGGDAVIGRWDLPAAVAVSEYKLNRRWPEAV